MKITLGGVIAYILWLLVFFLAVVFILGNVVSCAEVVVP